MHQTIAQVAAVRLLAAVLAMPCATSVRAQTESRDLQAVAQSVFTGRSAQCDGKTLIFYGIPAGMPWGPLPRPMLLEVQDLRFEYRNYGLSEADRLNGMQWQGEMSVQFRLYRSWNTTSKSWTPWANGMPTVYGKPIVARVSKQAGRTTIDQEHFFNSTIQPITCSAATNFMGGVSAAQQTSPTPAGQDPAISYVERQPLVPNDRRILTSGFGGFKIGQSISEAEAFFGFALEAPNGPAATAKARNCGILRRGKHEKPEIFLLARNERVMAFLLYDDSFRTGSGIAVGDPEEKVITAYSKLPSFKKNTPLGTQEGTSFYYSLFAEQPVSIRFIIQEKRVAFVEWGSTRELESERHSRCS